MSGECGGRGRGEGEQPAGGGRQGLSPYPTALTWEEVAGTRPGLCGPLGSVRSAGGSSATAGARPPGQGQLHFH